MSLINTFNTDENFWIVNPQFKNAEPFAAIHKSDKSRNKTRTSNLLWYVAQVCDDSQKNIFRNIQREERVHLLASDFMGDKDFYAENKQLLETLFEGYDKFHLTPARKALQEWETKMQERSEFIKDTPYSMDTYEQGADGKFYKVAGTSKQLDDMMKNSKHIYDLYHQILKSLAEEDEEAQVKGGQQLSLSDLGEI